MIPLQSRDTLLNQEIPVIIINAIMGVGTISLPSNLARSAGSDGIIAFIAAIGVVLVATTLFVGLVMRFPDKSFAEFSPQLIGSVPGYVLNFSLGLYFLYANAMVLRIFGDTVKVFLLPRTPLEVIMITMLVATATLARNGLKPIARSCQIILFIFFLPFLLLPFFAGIFDFGEFLPLFQADWQTMMQTTMLATFSLAGIEILLVIGSHAVIKQRFLRLSYLGVLIAGFFQLVLIALAFGSLSVEQAAKVRDPIFEMIKYLPIPALFIERADIFFFGIWITSSYSTILIALYVASQHLTKTFKLSNSKPMIVIIAIATYYLAKLPKNDVDIAHFNNYTALGWQILAFGIVPLLLLLSYIRKQGHPLFAKPKKGKKKKANP